MAKSKAGKIPLTGAGLTEKTASLVTEGVLGRREVPQSGGERLIQFSLVQEKVEALAKLSITTLEEAIGMARVEPEALGKVISPLAVQRLRDEKFQQRATEESSMVGEFPANERKKHFFGAQLEKTAADRSGLTQENGDEMMLIDPGSEWNLMTAPCMPPIGDQGMRPTCVAFATSAVMAYAWCRVGNGTADLSEQFQYWQCKCHDGLLPPYTSWGTLPDVSFALARRDGVCPECIWPYDPLKDPPQSDPNGPKGLLYSSPYRVRVAKEILAFTDVPTLKRYIRTDSPVAVAIDVFASWDNSAYTELTGEISMPLPGEATTCGHAMVLVGYRDDNDYAGGGFFIVRNSWGTGWGRLGVFGGGYGTIPYEYIRLYNHSAFIVSY